MRILIADDNSADYALLQQTLGREFPQAACAQVKSLDELERELARGCAAVVTEIRTAWAESAALLARLRQHDATLPVLLLTHASDLPATVAAWRAGFSDFLLKTELGNLPATLRHTIAKAAEERAAASAIQQLRESEERNRLLTSLTSDYAYVYRIEHSGASVAEWFTEGFEPLLGWTREEIVGRGGWPSLLHPDDVAHLTEKRQRLLNGETIERDVRLRTKAGEYRWVRNFERALARNGADCLMRVLGASQNITARKLTEESLREKEERLRLALQAAELSTWEWHPQSDARQAYGNERQFYGEVPTSGRDFLDKVHPEDRERLRESGDRSIQDGVVYREEFRFLHPDGKLRWIAATARGVSDESGGRYLIGVSQDITERRELEEERQRLLQREQSARLQLEAAIQRLSAIQSVTDAALATLELEQLLSELLARISNVLQGDTATVLLLAEDEQHWVVRASHGLEEELKERVRIPLRQGVIGQIAAQNEPMIFNDLSQIAAPTGLTGSLGRKTRALVGAPLSVHGKVIGIIHVGTKSKRQFTQEDLGLLQVVANRAASAIERSRLHEEVRAARDRLGNLSRQLLAAQETERRRLARELHDETGQALTAVKLNLQALKRRSDDEQLRARLDDSIGIVERSLEQIRNLSHELRPSLLDDLGLVAALRWFVDRQMQRAGINAHIRVADVSARTSSEIETACFRIVQEALTNVIRHAAAQNVWIELHSEPDAYRLIVRDDGNGFDVPSARERALRGGSLGLLGMQERAQLLGGRFEIKSEWRKGTVISVHFPNHTAAES